MKYGFIGLGTMGFPMCLNLLKSGFDLVVYDVNADAMRKLAAFGAKTVVNAGKISEEAEIVFLSLPHGGIVSSILKELLATEHLKTNIIADFSTISPKESRKFAHDAKGKGIIYFDSPVSGAVEGAENGTLTMMLGCDEEIFSKVKAPMEVMGEKMCFAGTVGCGSAVKLINNYLVGINNIMVCEVMILAKKLEMDLHTVFDIVNKSTGRSFTTETIYEVFLDNRNFEKGFKIDLLYKDLSLIMQLSKDVRFPLLIGENAIRILEMARSCGLGGNNTYGVVKMFEEMANIKMNEG